MRVDIQILRAISVLGVIAYHFEKDLFPNGYFGVDIFFVISGFLITKNIYNNLLINEFSFKLFYFKRFRRIIPSLISSLVFSIIIGFFLLSEELYFELIRSVIYSVFFIANIYFAQVTNYFDVGSERTLNINLWSLGIEEQFYFIFPLIIYLLFKFFKKKIVYLLILLLFISIFFYNENIFKILHLNKIFFTYENYLFYSPFTRAWQLLIGSICGIVYKNKKIKLNNIFLLVLIFFLLFLKIELSQFYLLPLLTSISLLSENDIKEVRLIKPFIHIGNISYSLYLFHQPIIAGFKNLNFYATPKSSLYFDFDKTINIFLIALIIYIVSLVNYTKIEKKYLNVRKFSLKQFRFIFFLMSFIFVFSVYSNQIYNLSFQNNFTIENNEYQTKPGTNFLTQNKNRLCVNRDSLNDACVFGNKINNMYFLGDSTLASTISGFLNDEILNSFKIIDYTQTGCMPILYTCDFFEGNQYYLDVTGIKNSTIIIGGTKDVSKFKGDSFLNSIELFLKNNNTVIFVGYIPKPKIDELMYYRINSNFLSSFNNNFYLEEIKQYEKYNKSVELLLSNLSIDNNFIYLDLFDYFCKNKECEFYKNKKFLFFDHVHLSHSGAQVVYKAFSNLDLHN